MNLIRLQDKEYINCHQIFRSYLQQLHGPG